MNHEKPIIKNKEWIGRIPSDWDFVKIKEHFVERNTKVDDISFPPLSVSMGGVVDQMENVSKSDNSGNRKLVKKNDFVINSRSDRKGSSGISPRDGSVSLINIVLKPKNINPKYSEYLFKSYYFKEEFFRNGKGIHFDLWSTRYELMKQIFIPYPKIEEQNKIVEYLDNETHQIEKLTKKIEQKIELLKEQRTSLINEVVTRGLNPDVEMKESGIEWIGEIPSHWELLRLNNLGRFSKGKGITKDNIKEGGNRCIRCGEIYTTYELRFNRTKSFIDDETSDESVLGSKGVLLFTGDGESLEEIGKCVVYEGNEELYVGGGINIFTPKQDKVIPIYLSYVMNSESVIYQKSRQGRGEIVVHIYSKQLKEIRLGLPPILEQNKIVEYLDEQTKKIDKTILIEEKKIKLLNEYKQSLISEVVTGKKRVV
tara:strand:+ start:5648 stop:6925 length:1278 start_codon:yes stop_codon:yes gene_type:complete